MRICSGFMLHIDVLLLPLLPLSRKYFNNFINLPSSKRAMHTHTQTHFCACHWRVYATVHLCCNLQPINGVAVLPLLLLFSFRIFFTKILNCHILWHSWVYLDNNNVRLYYQFIVVVVAAVFFFFLVFCLKYLFACPMHFVCGTQFIYVATKWHATKFSKLLSLRSSDLLIKNILISFGLMPTTYAF